MIAMQIEKSDTEIEGHRIERVTIEFDVISECSLSVAKEMLDKLDKLLTQPIPTLLTGPFNPNSPLK